MERDGKITKTQEKLAKAQPMGLRIQSARNELAPYYVEEVRKYLESTYGTEAVHERGLRVYTTLNVSMQRAAGSRRAGWFARLRPPARLARHPCQTF